MGMNRHTVALISWLIALQWLSAQDKGSEGETRTDQEAKREAMNLSYSGYQSYLEDRKIEAEANFRRAQAKDPDMVSSTYNLGTTQYRGEHYAEAFGNFKQAAEKAKTREEKHRAFHNLGNVLMQRKEYEQAVQAYKQALKNNPNDDETRYNYALAKEMLEKNPPQDNGGGGDNDQNQNNDQNNDQNEGGGNGDSDQQDGDQGDDKEDGKKDPDSKEKGDQGEDGEKEGDSENEEDKQGEDGSREPQEDKSDQPGQNKDQQPPKNDEKQPARPKVQQLSKENIQNLLEALENEEKRVQLKVQKTKEKGKPIKTKKDW